MRDGVTPGITLGRRDGVRPWSAAASSVLVVLGLGLGLPATAVAVVTEPAVPPSTAGDIVPKPSLESELAVITSRGFSAMAGTLQCLFTSRGETLDYVQDARTTPGTFSPRCPFTGQLVMRAGGCPLGLGWYNATEGATEPPPGNEIYELVPTIFPACAGGIDPATSCCDDLDFCPLAIYDTTQIPNHRWNMAPFLATDIRADPRYKGGLVGFALIGDPGGQCNQNKYSQLGLNQKATSGQPWVGAVVYQSTVEPSSYYLAFESTPNTPSGWRGIGQGKEADFNDLVLYLKGACPDTGTGGAGGGVGTPGSGGAGGGAGAAGGNNGSGGRNQGEQGGAAARGGASGSGGAAASGGATASGGAAASGGATASGGASASGGTGAGGAAGVPVANSSRSGCSCTTMAGEGAQGPRAAALLLALALVRRRSRRI